MKIPIIEITLYILRHGWILFVAGMFIGSIIVPFMFWLINKLFKEKKTTKKELQKVCDILNDYGGQKK